MDELAKFNNQTAGRDKIFRLVQYSSKIIFYSLEKRGANMETLKKTKNLDEVLSLMRRLLRFGRFYESIPGALSVMSSVSNPVVRLTSVLSKISNFIFMFIDHCVCMDKLGLLPSKMIEASKWDRVSTKFWLYSIVMALTRDVYEIMKIYKEEYGATYHLRKKQSGIETITSTSPPPSFKGHRKNRSGNQTVVKYMEKVARIKKIVVEHGDVTVDSIKNLCDICIPLNSLGFINLNSGFIGLLGVISTIVSILPQVNPMYKIVPAC